MSKTYGDLKSDFKEKKLYSWNSLYFSFCKKIIILENNLPRYIIKVSGWTFKWYFIGNILFSILFNNLIFIKYWLILSPYVSLYLSSINQQVYIVPLIKRWINEKWTRSFQYSQNSQCSELCKHVSNDNIS